MAPGVCFSLTSLTTSLLASAAGNRRTASLYTYSQCLGTSGCPRLSSHKFAVRDYVQLHECAPFPAAQRHQTWQAPSPDPSEQILAHGANGASLAPASRRFKASKVCLFFPSLPRPSTRRAGGAKLALFAPCAKICLDGPGLGACKVWWRCAAGK